MNLNLDLPEECDLEVEFLEPDLPEDPDLEDFPDDPDLDDLPEDLALFGALLTCLNSLARVMLMNGSTTTSFFLKGSYKSIS